MRTTRSDLCVVFVTAGSMIEARRLARAALEARLAACVNLVRGVESHYRWKGGLERGIETLLIMKTSRGLFRRLAALIRARHSYETPEIIAVSVAEAESSYAAWWLESIGGPHE